MADPTFLDLGRYRVVSVLSDRSSRFACVYEAQDTKSGERVAVKVLSLTTTHRDIAEAMFRKEVDALEGFSHPAVVRLLAHFSERQDNRLGIVLELVAGGRTLEQLIKDVKAGRETRFTLRWRLEQLAALLDGIDNAHRRNVVHRDVKLANILFDREQKALKLADFGIARLLEHYGRGVGGPTLSAFYTRPFAAPEQVLQGDTSFPVDLHAFGLVAASLLTWQIPDETFKREQLGTFLAPLKKEIPDEQVFRDVQKMIEDLLSDTPSLRPRAHEVGRLLQILLERTAERTMVPIRLTTTVRASAAAQGCRTDAAILDDFNDGMRGRYEVAKPNDASLFSLRCFGRSLWLKLVPDSDRPEELVAVALGRNEPNLHARDRERACAVPFTLSSGQGSAEALIQRLYGEYEVAKRREDERRQKESLLSVAAFILARQRERMTRLRIRYEAVDDGKPAKTGFGQKLQSALGEKAPANPADEHFIARGDFLKVRIVDVTPWDDDDEPPPGLVDSWTDSLDNKSPFLVDEQPIATFHGYDREARILSLRLKGQHHKLRRRGELECKDLALEASLARQERALNQFYDNDCVNPSLGRLLLYPEENKLGEILPRGLIQSLEPKDALQSLVEHALAAQDFFFVQGPPGTGKTTVIAEVMAQILKQKPDARILLTSQANEAVNHALEALHKLTLDLGCDWRMVRDVAAERKERDGEFGFDTVFRAWCSSAKDDSESALAALLPTLPQEQQELVRQALAKWHDRVGLVDDVREDFAASVQVFGVTCLRVPTLWRILREVRFDWVIVDEAAKATPAEVLVSLVAGRRFVLVGDHRQLPPFLDTETEQDVAAANLDVERARRSLFEELFEKVPPANRVTLRRQFRMHKSIGNLVGQLFYHDLGGLDTGVPDQDRTMILDRFNRTNRVFWLNVNGKDKQEGTSWFNESEIDAIVDLLRQIEAELRLKNGRYTVGVIAAYAAQARRLHRAIMPSGKAWSALKIRVDTVDAFQGKQDDIIVYSIARVGEGERRFLSDRRRLNVAFSRAQRLLIIVGHHASAERVSRLASAIAMIPTENLLEAEARR
jgi:serine/threonine protein kinase